MDIILLILVMVLLAQAIFMDKGYLLLLVAVGLTLLAFQGQEVEIVIMFLLGILALMVEFYIPTMGVVGVVGAVLVTMSTSNVLNTVDFLYFLIGTIIGVTFVFVYNLGKGKDIRMGSNLRLNTKSQNKDYTRYDLLGKEGTVVTTLRPSGTVEIGGDRYDVVSNEGYIEVGQGIKVCQVVGNKIVVEKNKQ